MSVREYIGARYVMKFADPIQHDSTTAYEPLTVVQHQGASYISKQYVPIGINISNTDYWIVLADFDAQIEQYREEVRTFDDRITTNATDIDAVEAKLPASDFSSSSTVKDAIDTVSTSVTNNAALLPASAFTSTNTVKKYVDDNLAILPASSFTNVNTVKKYIDDNIAVLERGKTDVVVLGDSLSRASYDSDTGNVISTGAELWTKFSEATGLTVHNYSVGGAAFSYTGFTNKTIQSQLNDANDDTSYDVSVVKCVIAFAGTNDYLNISASTMQTAIANLTNAYAGSRFGQAHIPFYIVFNQAGHGWNTNFYWSVGLRIGHMANAKYVKYLNGSSILKAYPSSYPYIASSDGVHPSNYGYNMLSQSFANLVRGQGFLVDRAFTVNSISATGFTTSTNAYVQNGHFFCRGSIIFKSGNTQTSNVEIPILRFKDLGGSMTSENFTKRLVKGYSSIIYEGRAETAGLKYSLSTTTDGYDGILNVICQGISTTGPAADINTYFIYDFEL